MSKFQESLQNFIGSVTNAKKYAQEASMLALEHYKDSGDTIYLNQMAKALREHAKSFVRLGAFLEWAVTFGGVKWENELFSKDKSLVDFVVNMEKAGEKTFWEFMPERVPSSLSAADIISRLNAVIKSFENSKTFTLDDAGKTLIADAKKAIAGLSVARKVSSEVASAGELKEAA